MLKKNTLILSLVTSSFLLTGCVGAALGVGAAVGVSAAKEGGIHTSIRDEAIRVKISDLWFRKSTDIFSKLNLSVNQGRVLVTGVVQNPDDRVEAIRLAWQPQGVKQVINEIRVGNSATFSSFAQDTWIAGQLRTRLTFDKYIQSINYSIEVVRGTVYLMGVAQNQQELDRTINVARSIKGVNEVISYAKLAGVDANMAATEVEGRNFATDPSKKVDIEIQPPAEYTQQPVPLNNGMPSSSPSSIQSEVLPP